MPAPNSFLPRPHNNNHSINPNLWEKLRRQRESLPIASVKGRLVHEVEVHDVLIIVGETGSGKTTQLPQFLFDEGFCRNGMVIGVTQPRRVAAITVAQRVAEECGVELGTKVGYSVRFDDRTSRDTKIKYMTDGLLLREALSDRHLSKYSVIVVDEAHERTVHTDVLLGILKIALLARVKCSADDHQHDGFMEPCQAQKISPLKLIIMSASLDAHIFSDYFGGASVVHVEGRQHPVDILYTVQPHDDYVEAAFVTIFQIHLEEGPGDVLVFLTGQEEIESVEKLIKEQLCQLPEANRQLIIASIFSSLPSEQQMRVFMPTPAGHRKVILATNIAETSVTIPGIKYVVDPGFVKARTYDPDNGIESLIVIPTSKAQAIQRSGRAGREGPGKCFRLYPETEFEKLENSTQPEIKRCNLSNVVLQLKALDIDVRRFRFMEKPLRNAILKSLQQLILLGALTEIPETNDYNLSDPVGKQMAQIPLDPIYSKALILASQFKCLEEMLIAVAMLSAESIFYTSREKSPEVKAAVKCFASPEGDHFTLINVYRAADELLEKRRVELGKEKAKEKNDKILRKWCKVNFINNRSLTHARDIYRQIRGNLEQMNFCITSCGDDNLRFQKCLAASFFLNAALKQPDGTYRTLASGQTVQIHPSSILFRSKVECVIFNELVQTSHKYIHNVTRIDSLWLAEHAPQLYAMQC